MKRIYITLFALLIAMVAMVYLYFSKLTTQYTSNDISLNAATTSSGFVFCMRNDQDIINILGGQDDFSRLIGSEKSKELNALRNQLLSKTAIRTALNGNNIYIGFMPGKDRSFNYLITTQLTDQEDQSVLMNTLKSSAINLDSLNGILKIQLKDSTVFYLGMHHQLILLSNTDQPVIAALHMAANQKGNDFAAYIKTGDKFNKNSVANLYVDFNRFPDLLKVISPNSSTGELSIFNQQHSFAVLSYNFSKERVFFNGSGRINDARNYLSLFAGLSPQKNVIDHILPDHTANFTLFSIPEYASWQNSLNHWMVLNKKSAVVKKTISAANQKYHLNLEQIFPAYFKNQLITFQLKTSEKLGAIQLTNGDKVSQLLLDMSENYSTDIKLLKEADLLYCYFGEPFKKFRKPYYTIIDNYMVFSNYASTVQNFLNSYRNNNLLINTADYSSLYNQVSDNATVTFYVNHKNSANLIRNTFYTNYFRYFEEKNGFAKFNALIYQLNGDKGAFQSNLLINSTTETTKDSNLSPQQALPEISEQ